MSAIVIPGRFPQAAPPSSLRSVRRPGLARRLAHFFHFPGAELYSGQHAAAALQIEFLYPHRKTWWGGF
jgi:hypothetical protein